MQSLQQIRFDERDEMSRRRPLRSGVEPRASHDLLLDAINQNTVFRSHQEQNNYELKRMQSPLSSSTQSKFYSAHSSMGLKGFSKNSAKSSSPIQSFSRDAFHAPSQPSQPLQPISNSPNPFINSVQQQQQQVSFKTAGSRGGFNSFSHRPPLPPPQMLFNNSFDLCFTENILKSRESLASMSMSIQPHASHDLLDELNQNTLYLRPMKETRKNGSICR
jgi:hypothetical protein